jgi:hypothetical protein
MRSQAEPGDLMIEPNRGRPISGFLSPVSGGRSL